MSNSKYINKYAVVTVYNDGDGAQPLVHVEDVFGCISAAKKFAREVAQEMLKTYNDAMDKENRLKFKDVWENRFEIFRRDKSNDCAKCGECIKACPNKAISYDFR